MSEKEKSEENEKQNSPARNLAEDLPDPGCNSQFLPGFQKPLNPQEVEQGAYPLTGWNKNWCPATMGGTCHFVDGICTMCKRKRNN